LSVRFTFFMVDIYLSQQSKILIFLF
ncbi:putative polysaccharide biosynthesis domain protein, partial [Vibrio parahaemolyticus EKP-021]